MSKLIFDMAMDINSGEVHCTSTWNDEEGDD